MKAREEFCRAVRCAGGSKEAARLLGCTRAYVDMVRNGGRRPGMRVAHAIERTFGIPMQSWMVVAGDAAMDGSA